MPIIIIRLLSCNVEPDLGGGGGGGGGIHLKP